jgi:GAF domain-containing protein
MTPTDIFASLAAFNSDIADASSSHAPWRALQGLADRLIGAKLFTVMTVDVEEGLARRLYTNMPDAYPVSGTKPVTVTPWFEHTILQRRLFVMNTNAEIAEHFADHELIASLGCGSCVNMPVVMANRVLGTVNMLGPAGFFTPERVATVEHLRIPAIAAFAAARA